MSAMFVGSRIRPECIDRAKKIASVLRRISPDILGVCEGPRYGRQFEAFLDQFVPELGLKTAHSTSRGYENLILAYCPAFEVLSVDGDLGFYDTWLADPDRNGLTKKFWWDKQPLEVVFRHLDTATIFRIIQVHGPTKGILQPVTLFQYQKISLAKRIQMFAEAQRLRVRVEQLLHDKDAIPFLVQGDMNDGPDLDYSERLLGGDYLRALMGNLYTPSDILCDALGYQWKDPESKPELWTCTYEDPIIKQAFDQEHRVWIDHQLLSQSLISRSAVPRLVEHSGQVDTKDETSVEASDHFAIWCDLDFEGPSS
jgi:hypothetical protein